MIACIATSLRSSGGSSTSEGMLQTGLTILREVWGAKPSTKNPNLALLLPDRNVGAAACLKARFRDASGCFQRGGVWGALPSTSSHGEGAGPHIPAAVAVNGVTHFRAMPEPVGAERYDSLCCTGRSLEPQA
jgi:phage tail tape-measure protein